MIKRFVTFGDLEKPEVYIVYMIPTTSRALQRDFEYLYYTQRAHNYALERKEIQPGDFEFEDCFSGYATAAVIRV